jgi:hypothetical protein
MVPMRCVCLCPANPQGQWALEPCANTIVLWRTHGARGAMCSIPPLSEAAHENICSRAWRSEHHLDAFGWSRRKERRSRPQRVCRRI